MKPFFVTLIFLLGLSQSGATQSSELSPLTLPAGDSQMFSDAHQLDASATHRSGKIAMVMSAILPGWGQLYLGSRRHAVFFFGTETAVWSARTWFKTRQHWREDEYKLFAAVHAGVDPAGKSSDYWSNLQDYYTSDDYNEAQRRDARLSDSAPDHLYSEAEGWMWASKEKWYTYDRLKDEAWKNERWAGYMIGAALINRLLAVVDVARLARHRREATSELHLHLNEDIRNPGVQLSWIHTY
ncbi:MAG: hypothetical protein D6675_02070 [Gemmatimonadetes bacterium]|nr:MAG: hypothetical protein D6675_02070 [Gemmatimonadota bacterium]